MIPESTIQALRERTPDVLIHYGVTNPSGSFKAVWRESNKAACIYSPESQLITDYQKDERFNVFELVGRMEPSVASFPDRVKRVAEIVGYGEVTDIRTPFKPSKPQRARPTFEPPQEVGYEAESGRMYAELRARLFQSEDALAYLHGRGFSDKKIACNVLGFVPNRKCIVDDETEKPLFTMYEPNKVKGYIVIPFPMDKTFRMVNYCMLRAIPGETPPKYKELRPKGYKTPLYREWLLSARCKTLYVVEGLLDCLALEELIHKPTLALGGVGMHKRMVNILNATPKELRPQKIVIAMDADEEGQKTDAKIAKYLDLLEIPHSSFKWPDGAKDACDVLARRR